MWPVFFNLRFIPPVQIIISAIILILLYNYITSTKRERERILNSEEDEEEVETDATNASVAVSEKDILGALAKYAVIQSPYPVPDNLALVLQKVHEKIKMDFELQAPLYFMDFDFDKLQTYLTENFESVQEYCAWNVRKNGKAGFGSVSIHDDPEEANPDNEFIDLDALTTNVTIDIFKDNT